MFSQKHPDHWQGSEYTSGSSYLKYIWNISSCLTTHRNIYLFCLSLLADGRIITISKRNKTICILEELSTLVNDPRTFTFNKEKVWYICCVKSVFIRSYSGSYFSTFGLNTERYRVSFCIQFECGKIRTRIIQNTDTFHTVICLEIVVKFCQ